jgi:hypothetical protein
MLHNFVLLQPADSVITTGAPSGDSLERRFEVAEVETVSSARRPQRRMHPAKDSLRVPKKV